ncbi:MAG: type II toxin-antitoxin system YoeB family toxin [Deltaproteobacteria bacterium]|nr:type II toxin-antitoxin system YoeB family toxin [Deltaproteobacteria bacterium]
MPWTVIFKDPKRIEKAVDKLRPSTQVAFRQAIQDMNTEGPCPRGWNVKPLKGEMSGLMRLCLDHRHRLIYSVSQGALTILVIEVSTREGAY